MNRRVIVDFCFTNNERECCSLVRVVDPLLSFYKGMSWTNMAVMLAPAAPEGLVCKKDMGIQFDQKVMKQNDIAKHAEAFFESGFNCAESVSQAILEAFAETGPKDIPRVASAFGGGIGGTRDGLCGALSGGLIAIGYLLGRVSPTESVDEAKSIAAEFKRRYEKLYGTTNCGELLDKFEPQENYNKCQEMVGKMTGVLVRVLREHGIKMKR